MATQKSEAGGSLPPKRLGLGGRLFIYLFNNLKGIILYNELMSNHKIS